MIHWATYLKFDSILDDLIEKQISFVGHFGIGVTTPLCIAAEEGHISTVVKLMLSLPAPFCAQLNYENQNVLHVAAAKTDKEMVKGILTYCPTELTFMIISQKDVNGDTPFSFVD